MRKLAGSLGVNHGTLYWHVENKQALIDALANDLLTGVADDSHSSAAGMERLAELAHRLRAALLSHRDGARILAGTFVRESHTLTFGEAAIGAALDAGLTKQDAVLLAFSVQYYVTGFAIEEQAAHQRERTGDTPCEAISTSHVSRSSGPDWKSCEIPPATNNSTTAYSDC